MGGRGGRGHVQGIGVEAGGGEGDLDADVDVSEAVVAL